MGSRVCTDCKRELGDASFHPTTDYGDYQSVAQVCIECTSERVRRYKEQQAVLEPQRLAERQARAAAWHAERKARRCALIPTWSDLGQGIGAVLILAAFAVLIVAAMWGLSTLKHGLFGDGPPNCNVTYSDCGE